MPEPKPRSRPKAAKADPAQSAKFIAMAREAGCEENFDLLDKALRGAKLPARPVQPQPDAPRSKRRRPAS